MAAVIFYQAATIKRNPGSSLAWITIMCEIFVAVLLFLRQTGNKDKLWGYRLDPAGIES